MQSKTLKITAFLDGTPGHEKQTLGILDRLSELISTEVSFVKVTDTSFFYRATQFFLLFFGLKLFVKNADKEVDLIIGTGRKTHIPMLRVKQKTKCKVFTCMTPSWLIRSKFDLCFVPYHDNLTETHNIVRTFGPPNQNSNAREHAKDKGLILIGGIDHKSHHWEDEKIIGYITQIALKERDIAWTISSSPRTPQSCVTHIQKLTKNHPNLTFFNYKDTPDGWIEEQYKSNQTVWVTADSLSMVYEALSAGNTVGLLPVKWKKGAQKFIRSENSLMSEKLVFSYSDWLVDNIAIKQKTLNEAKKCANEIITSLKF